MMEKISNSDVQLFDESAGYEDEGDVQFAPGLSDEDKQKAMVLYRLFNELWGLCLITGDPGTGKDCFGNYISYQIKRFFPHKRIMRDERPRKLYGEYAGLFNENVLAEDLARMKALSSGLQSFSERNFVLEKAADDWVSKRGQVMLKNSVLYLTEFWNYCYKRDPHKPINKTMGGIHKMKRHLDCLILGTTQQVEDLDRFTCLPWVDWQVICTRSRVNKTGFVFWVQKVRYDRRVEILIHTGRPFPIIVDAGKPIGYLGDGKIKVKKLDYKPETEEEQIVLNVLKAGAETYEDLVEFISEHGDMSETEILNTLKHLKFNKRKHVVDYPCWFSIYNSKSAPNLKTSLKLQEV